MDSPKTATANWKTQYLVTYNANAPVTLPSDEWVDSGQSATGIFPSDEIQGSTKYVYQSDDRPAAITSPTTITAMYRTQYLVTYAANALVTLPADEWVDDGQPATGVFPAVDAQGSTRYVYQSDDRPATITSPTTITATYQTQHYLTVTSPYGTTSGEGWYDDGTVTQAEVDPLVVTDPDGTQHLFTGWSDDASGITSPSNPITMDSPKTATANWIMIENSDTVSGWENRAISSVNAGDNVHLSFSNLMVDNITFSAAAGISNAQVVVKDLVGQPGSISIGPPNNPYGYFAVELVNFNSAMVSNIVLTFKVSKTWISANGIDEGTMTLNRWDSGSGTWTSYPAAKVGEDATYSYFSVSLPGFSFFSISGSTLPTPTAAPAVPTFRPPSYAPPAPAAAFTIFSLTITPRPAAPGDVITITFDVLNFGQVEGSGTIEMFMDGLPVATWNVTLAAGETRTISYNLTDVVGSHEILITGGAFDVRDGLSVRTPTPTGAGVDTVALGGSVVIAMLLLTLLFVVLRRK
ncbi:MAG: PGF-pre-PGF domain-containing protein [Candidatus Hadarchaeales archaeon]